MIVTNPYCLTYYPKHSNHFVSSGGGRGFVAKNGRGRWTGFIGFDFTAGFSFLPSWGTIGRVVVGFVFTTGFSVLLSWGTIGRVAIGFAFTTGFSFLIALGIGRIVSRPVGRVGRCGQFRGGVVGPFETGGNRPSPISRAVRFDDFSVVRSRVTGGGAWARSARKVSIGHGSALPLLSSLRCWEG
jgi:hypothetical protein